jgi:hypothetical protein
MQAVDTVGLRRRLDAQCIGSSADNIIATLTKKTDKFDSYEIARALLLQVLTQADTVMRDQPVLLDLCTPLKVVGDIKGQLSDLQQLLEMHGDPAHTGYLFMGNYLAPVSTEENSHGDY